MKFSDKDSKPQIVYSDNHVCVALKPPGMVVQMEDNQRESLESYLKSYFQRLLDKETIYLLPIHRLDKPVGGLVVFARSSKAMKRLQEAQRNKEIQKFYVAKVHGVLKQKRALLKHFLFHGDYRAIVDPKRGKEAKLLYRVIREFRDESLLTIRLLTGRYHQIRAQLSAIGHPILGDEKYGSNQKFERDAITLFHTKVSFPHPVTKKRMVFTVRPNTF